MTSDNPSASEQKPIANLLTVAEAVAHTLRERGLRTAYAYPGTSELALCAALGDAGIRVLNARGDKEAVFMAAGHNAVDPSGAIAVLHGARGLTNALGAIADVRRSEFPVLCLVGLPSRESAPYLPPHAEYGLIAHAGRFACHALDCAELEPFDPNEFLGMLSKALAPAPGPTLLGLPQDLATARCVPRSSTTPASGGHAPVVPTLVEATSLAENSERPVILIDDYLLRGDAGIERALGDLASALGAPVYQVAYRRGPMLFQRAQRHLVPTLRGPFDPVDPAHAHTVADADLIITVEDRNMYPRVIGPMPSCPKIAITSRPDAAHKNGYLDADDLVIEGSPGPILRALADRLVAKRRTKSTRVQERPVGQSASLAATSAESLVAALGQALQEVQRPSIVDDSQMFGGLVSHHYHLLPPSVRVIGSHGGFVGGGLATAVGVAAANGPTLCLLGDQAFTNGVGALAAAGDLDVPLVALVCNNGTSVSLRTQAAAEGLESSDGMAKLLQNSTAMDYAAIAHGYGINAQTLTWPDQDTDLRAVEEASKVLHAVLANALRSSAPFLLELRVPGSGPFWAGIWRVSGNEAAAGHT